MFTITRLWYSTRIDFFTNRTELEKNFSLVPVEFLLSSSSVRFVSIRFGSVRFDKKFGSWKSRCAYCIHIIYPLKVFIRQSTIIFFNWFHQFCFHFWKEKQLGLINSEVKTTYPMFWMSKVKNYEFFLFSYTRLF